MRTCGKSIVVLFVAVVFVTGGLLAQSQQGTSGNAGQAVQNAQQAPAAKNPATPQVQPAPRTVPPATQAVPPTGYALPLWDHDGDGIPNGQDPDFIRGAGQGRRLNFVDANDDGICDFYQNRLRGWGNGAGFGRGWWRASAARNAAAWGPRYIDLNGDGIADTVVGQGRMMGRPGGRGGGPNFVDANGDGICDYYQQGGQRLELGRGYRGGRDAGAKR